MKTVKLFGTAVAMCLFVVACAESDPSTSAARRAGVGGGAAGDAGANEKIDLSKGPYEGANLKLRQSGDKVSAQIIISGKDAAELNKRLKVKEVETTQEGSEKAFMNKKGEDISCSSSSQQADSEENQAAALCHINMNAKTGAVLPDGTEVVEDSQAKDITEAYSGERVSILDGDSSTAIVNISGEDAKALYQTLTTATKEEVGDGSWLKMNTKEGYQVTCIEQVVTKEIEQKEYRCSLSVSLSNGSVAKSDGASSTGPSTRVSAASNKAAEKVEQEVEAQAEEKQEETTAKEEASETTPESKR